MIRVVDSIMGNGKTTWAINYMNANPQKRFIYITPYLQEAERIVKKCPELQIKQPTDDITKQASFLQMLKDGENMAISHELFMRQEWSDAAQACIREYGYTLILDEVLEVVKAIQLSKADHRMLVETEKIVVGDDGRVTWTDKKYKGKFEPMKRMANSGTLIQTEDHAVLWIMPAETLRVFSEIYVLTFMFNGSHMKHYLDLNGFAYQMCYVEGDELHEGVQNLAADKVRIHGLLDIYEGPLNVLGERDNAFSKNWWRNKRLLNVAAVRNDICKYLRYICDAKSEESMWSVFADMKKKCSPNGYSKGFCPCNARATNAYKDRKYLAYMLNVYENPEVVKWFAGHGIKVNQEAFALSQLVQWIWRSQIRDGKPVKLYLPSKRMRRILLDWLDEK